MEEDDILSTVEASCSSDTKQGDWISKYDIVEVDRGLKIEEQESSRRCHQECKTISKACEESIGDVDTDLGELLWKDELSLSKLINKVCYEMTDACTRKVPEFKKGKRNDEEFKPLSADEKKAYDIWKKMKYVITLFLCYMTQMALLHCKIYIMKYSFINVRDRRLGEGGGLSQK